MVLQQPAADTSSNKDLLRIHPPFPPSFLPHHRKQSARVAHEESFRYVARKMLRFAQLALCLGNVMVYATKLTGATKRAHCL